MHKCQLVSSNSFAHFGLVCDCILIDVNQFVEITLFFGLVCVPAHTHPCSML